MLATSLSLEALWRPPVPPTFSNRCCSCEETEKSGGRRLAPDDPSDSDPDPDSDHADSQSDSDPAESDSEFESAAPRGCRARVACLMHLLQRPAYCPVKGGALPLRIRLWQTTQLWCFGQAFPDIIVTAV